MQIPKQQLAEAVECAGHIADCQLIAAFVRGAATEFSSNPFPRTSAGAVGYTWGAQAFEFRVLGVTSAGLSCLLAAISALDRDEPLVQVILRSGAHTLNLFHHEGGHRIVGVVLYGKPNVPLPVFTTPKPQRRPRTRTNPAQLDLFAEAS